jgi:hypothetical protein
MGISKLKRQDRQDRKGERKEFKVIVGSCNRTPKNLRTLRVLRDPPLILGDLGDLGVSIKNVALRKVS